MESVFKQSFSEYEYLIIDGGSTDGSKEIIEDYAERLAYWISEKDKGIYNAMNKGIEKATGEYLLFLNSGDYLTDETICTTMLCGVEDIDIIYGNSLRLYLDGTMDVWKPRANCSVEFLIKDTIPHSSTFIRRYLFDKYGFYNERFLIVSDWAFFFKVLVTGVATTLYKDIDVSIFEMGGISNKKENRHLLLEERRIYVSENLPFAVRELLKQKNELEEKNSELTNLLRSKKFLLRKFLKELFGKLSN